MENNIVDQHWTDKKVFTISFLDHLQHNSLLIRTVVVDEECTAEDVTKMFTDKYNERITIKRVEFIEYAWVPK